MEFQLLKLSGSFQLSIMTCAGRTDVARAARQLKANACNRNLGLLFDLDGVSWAHSRPDWAASKFSAVKLGYFSSYFAVSRLFNDDRPHTCGCVFRKPRLRTRQDSKPKLITDVSPGIFGTGHTTSSVYKNPEIALLRTARALFPSQGF